MKGFVIGIFAVCLISSCYAVKADECLDAIKSNMGRMKSLLANLESKNEATVLKEISECDVFVHPVILGCDQISTSAEFKKLAGDKNDCYNLVHDSFFMAAIARKISLDKDWSSFYKAKDDVTAVLRKAKLVCSQTA